MITIAALALTAAPCGIPHKHHKAHVGQIHEAPLCAFSPAMPLPVAPDIEPITFDYPLTRYVVLTQQEPVSTVTCFSYQPIDMPFGGVLVSRIGRAPEIDPSGAIPALTLLLGWFTVLCSKRK